MFTRSSRKQDDTMKKAEPALPPRREASGAPSIISDGVSIIGNIDSPGEIQLDGTIDGDVRCHALTLGESGAIRGRIVAETVVIKGRVEGEIAGRSVRLEKTADLKGDIMHQTLSVEAGARIAGRLMHSDQPLETLTAKPSSAPVAVTDKAGKAKPEPELSPAVLK